MYYYSKDPDDTYLNYSSGGEFGSYAASFGQF
jgi:hypothetical protein